MTAKAIIYARVSDARQIENTSLVSQQEVCREWCDRGGLEVARVFVERGESAKSADRSEFQAMFEYLSACAKGTISHVLVYKFDRFSRNVEDGAEYRLRLRKLGIVLRSATEATDDSPAGKFLTTMLSAVGQFDNDTRAERTMSGMKNRLKGGRWQWPAPTGYLPGSKSGPSMVHDPIRGPHVKELFRLVSTGEYTKATALARITELGLRSRTGAPLTQETIRKMLVNPLYAGEMLIVGWGASVRGDFEPLVDQGTFDRVQMVLAGRAPASVAHVREREAFPLRGLVLCKACGQLVTASVSTGKLGSKFRYYRCHRVKGHLNVRAEAVEAAFVDVLDRLAPKPERLALIQRIFRESWTERIWAASVECASIRREIAKQEARKTRVLEQMADGVLSATDFANVHKKTEAALATLRARLALSEAEGLDLEQAIEYLTHLLWNTSVTWQSSGLQGKQQLQRRVFPEGLIFDGRGFGTPVTHSIYTLLGDDSLNEEFLVAPQGFEPRLDESESSVLPLNERATQIETAAAGSAGATISRLTKCTREEVRGQRHHFCSCGVYLPMRLSLALMLSASSCLAVGQTPADPCPTYVPTHRKNPELRRPMLTLWIELFAAIDEGRVAERAWFAALKGPAMCIIDNEPFDENNAEEMARHKAFEEMNERACTHTNAATGLKNEDRGSSVTFNFTVFGNKLFKPRTASDTRRWWAPRGSANPAGDAAGMFRSRRQSFMGARRTLSGCAARSLALLFAQHFERLLPKDAMTREPARGHRQ
jgi:site-specific DNA recombinase